MTMYRVRRGDNVLWDGELADIRVATMRVVETSTRRSRADRHDYVLDERVGASWRPRVTIHPPARW